MSNPLKKTYENQEMIPEKHTHQVHPLGLPRLGSPVGGDAAAALRRAERGAARGGGAGRRAGLRCGGVPSKGRWMEGKTHQKTTRKPQKPTRKPPKPAKPTGKPPKRLGIALGGGLVSGFMMVYGMVCC